MHSPGVVRRHLARAGRRDLLTHVVVGLLLATAIILTGDELDHHIRAIETHITTLGPWAVPAFIALFVLATSLLLPDTILSITAGALFGVACGIAAVVVGSLIAAALQYTLARGLLRDRIERALASRPSLAGIRHAVLGGEIRLQALLRLTPLNPATLSYVLGAAGVRFRGFMLASLALVPDLVLEVYFGYAGKHVARIAGRSTREVDVHDAAVLIALLVTLVVMVVIARTAVRAVTRTVTTVAPPSGMIAS